MVLLCSYGQMRSSSNLLLTFHSKQNILKRAQLKKSSPILIWHSSIVLSCCIDKSSDFLWEYGDNDRSSTIGNFWSKNKAFDRPLYFFTVIAVRPRALFCFDIMKAGSTCWKLSFFLQTGNIAAKIRQKLLDFRIALILLQHIWEKAFQFANRSRNILDFAHVAVVFLLPSLLARGLYQICKVFVSIVLLNNVIAPLALVQLVCSLILVQMHVV